LYEEKFLKEVLDNCTGTSYPAISSGDLGNIPIFLPCLSEQQKIADFLSAIDEKIEVSEKKLEKLIEWKKGLLQQMFV